MSRSRRSRAQVRIYCDRGHIKEIVDVYSVEGEYWTYGPTGGRTRRWTTKQRDLTGSPRASGKQFVMDDAAGYRERERLRCGKCGETAELSEAKRDPVLSMLFDAGWTPIDLGLLRRVLDQPDLGVARAMLEAQAPTVET